ncbi:MAG: flagellin lysine-N-methylase [Terracidiphilus sp.]
MRKTSLIRPEYSQRFRCIGPACEDSCCQGWAVNIDQPAYEKYQNVAPGPLRTLLDESIERTPDAPNPLHFARMRMPASLTCPMLNEERLCRIHAELGEEFLCHTCATYPRIVSSIDGIEEKALSLSCPEAARLVLLDPDLMQPKGDGGYQMTWDDTKLDVRALLPFYWPIREIVLTLVRNRAYPLWQRLFLIGTLCRRLDAVTRRETDRGVAPVLQGISAAVAQGSLRTAMETIPADLALQLDMVLQLAGLCRERAQIGARFLESVDAFRRGIAAVPNATMETLIAAYAAAYDRHYAPFFAAHPHILENYLINAMFRRQFPYGTKDGKLILEPEMAREFATLSTQFALIKGLLIGVAGFHKEHFSADHIIYTVQSASKHFEHHPQFLDQMQALLASTGRDNPHGLTMLLRN